MLACDTVRYARNHPVSGSRYRRTEAGSRNSRPRFSFVRVVQCDEAAGCGGNHLGACPAALHEVAAELKPADRRFANITFAAPPDLREINTIETFALPGAEYQAWNFESARRPSNSGSEFMPSAPFHRRLNNCCFRVIEGI